MISSLEAFFSSLLSHPSFRRALDVFTLWYTPDSLSSDSELDEVVHIMALTIDDSSSESAGKVLFSADSSPSSLMDNIGAPDRFEFLKSSRYLEICSEDDAGEGTVSRL
jgi:hypothetical protein